MVSHSLFLLTEILLTSGMIATKQTVTATGRITEIEDGAYINVKAKLGLTTMLKKIYQLCDLDDVDCPLTREDDEVNISFSLDTATAVRILPHSTFIQ